MLNHHNLFICVNGNYYSVIAITVRINARHKHNKGFSQSRFALSPLLSVSHCSLQRNGIDKSWSVFFWISSWDLNVDVSTVTNEFQLYLSLVLFYSFDWHVWNDDDDGDGETKTTIVSVNIFMLFYKHNIAVCRVTIDVFAADLLY